jgi:hypothetical protein
MQCIKSGMSADMCRVPPCSNAWKGGAQNHQPATEGDWNERRLRALQGGPQPLCVLLGTACVLWHERECCPPLAQAAHAPFYHPAVYYEMMPIRQANADNKQQVRDPRTYPADS